MPLAVWRGTFVGFRGGNFVYGLDLDSRFVGGPTGSMQKERIIAGSPDALSGNEAIVNWIEEDDSGVARMPT